MKKKYILFNFDENCRIDNKLSSRENYNVLEFAPSFFKMKVERFNSVKDFLIHVFWFVLTKRNYRIAYIIHDEKIIHYSYVIPKTFKISFMSQNDLEIGPCYPDPKYRGQGIFPYVVKYLIKKYNDSCKTFCMIAVENNIASQSGILKAGLRKSGVVYKNLFGIYRVVSSQN